NRGGSGTIHGMYYTASPDTSDYNNVYVAANNSSSYFGYYGGNQATLSAWQTATSDDANSLDVNPVFANPATGDYSPSVVSMDNTGFYLGIADDINGAVRGFTPDIGAFEFTVPLCTSPPTPGVASASDTLPCAGSNIDLDLTGFSVGLGQFYDWQMATSASGPYTTVSGP